MIVYAESVLTKVWVKLDTTRVYKFWVLGEIELNFWDLFFLKKVIVLMSFCFRVFFVHKFLYSLRDIKVNKMVTASLVHLVQD